MNEIIQLALAWGVGLVLGIVFFGGLWLTVYKSVSSPRPALWFITSLVLRMSVVVMGFYFVSGGDWLRLLICLFGLVVARLIVMRLSRQQEDERNHLAGVASRAP